jgi:NTE family protein
MGEHSVALALAAGGARGAYQAGALLYFAERGIVFDAVAGTSIGSLNGAFYAAGDGSAGHVGRLAEYWRRMPEAGVMQVSGDVGAEALKSALGAALKADPLEAVSFLYEFVTGGFSLFDPRPVAALLDGWLDYEAVCASRTAFTVVVLPERLPFTDVLTPFRSKALYLDARDLTPHNLRQALLAASAIPFAFPSQEIDGVRYADAGLADPLPARILYERGARRILSVFLSDSPLQNRLDFPDCALLQLRPSHPIDSGLPSTFDFSRPSIEFLIELGYRDAAANYEEVARLAGLYGALWQLSRANQKLADALPDRGGRTTKI